MRILIATDAARPQVNGVVRMLDETVKCLESMGHEVILITHELYKTFPCPTYPEIRLAYNTWITKKIIDTKKFDHIHIMTEGPIGFAVRNYAIKNKIEFTTSYHTNFPDYVKKRCGLPLCISYAFLRYFHSKAKTMMCMTRTIKKELEKKEFENCSVWHGGVDTEIFTPNGNTAISSSPTTIFMNVGRISIEKNIPAFLDLDLPGRKIVVGDGPMLEELKEKYKNVLFVGAKHGEELAEYYRSAHVMVFPSRSDTFGLVQIESGACGTPVAAYPESGPKEALTEGVTGCMRDDLKTACLKALELNREICATHTKEKFSWNNSTKEFLNNIRN